MDILSQGTKLRDNDFGNIVEVISYNGSKNLYTVRSGTGIFEIGGAWKTYFSKIN